MGNFQIVDLNVNISLEFMNFIMKLVTEICHFNFLSFYYLSKNFIKFIPISSRTFQHGDVDLIAQLVKKSACNAGDPSSIPGALNPCPLCLLRWQMGPSPLSPHRMPKCQLPVFI